MEPDSDQISDKTQKILELQNDKIADKMNALTMLLQDLWENQKASCKQSLDEKRNMLQQLEEADAKNGQLERKIAEMREDMDTWCFCYLDYLLHRLALYYAGKPLPASIDKEAFEGSGLWSKLRRVESFIEEILSQQSEELASLALENAALQEQVAMALKENKGLKMILTKELSQPKQAKLVNVDGSPGIGALNLQVEKVVIAKLQDAMDSEVARLEKELVKKIESLERQLAEALLPKENLISAETQTDFEPIEFQGQDRILAETQTDLESEESQDHYWQDCRSA